MQGLNQLLYGQNTTNERLERIERKMDSVIEQTAYLTESRTEGKEVMKNINTELNGIRGDLKNVK